MAEPEAPPLAQTFPLAENTERTHVLDSSCWCNPTVETWRDSAVLEHQPPRG